MKENWDQKKQTAAAALTTFPMRLQHDALLWKRPLLERPGWSDSVLVHFYFVLKRCKGLYIFSFLF